jgi:hypothetical protein
MAFDYATKTKAKGQHPWIAVNMDEGELLNSGSYGYAKKNYQEDISNLECISKAKDHPKGADFQKICMIVSPWHMGKYIYKQLPMGIKIFWMLMFFKTSCLSLSKIWNILRQP